MKFKKWKKLSRKTRRIILNSLVAAFFMTIIILLLVANNKKDLHIASQTCSSCGKTSSIVAVFCQHCGVTLDRDDPSGADDELNLSMEDYIQLSTAEDVYALARILSTQETKRAYYGAGYDLNADIDRFALPEGVTDLVSKLDYLSNAAYILTNDIELVFQSSNDMQLFLGIGSEDLPFKGVFNGNHKTIKLTASGSIVLNNDTNYSFGLFGLAVGAKILNVNIEASNDIIISQCARAVKYGVLVGYCENSKISNCHIKATDASLGVKFDAAEKNTNGARVGAVVGECQYSVIEKSTVSFSNSTLFATGDDMSVHTSTYALFSVGGILGFSQPGSDNTTDIGKVGNQMIDCHFVANNTTKKDVMAASISYGDEVDVGGLVGCSFNNFVAKNCSVKITNGNLVAEKSGMTDNAKYGTNCGGLVGRLEHTGELVNCSVWGDYMSIISKSPENYSTAGGLVGFDIGASHRDIISLNTCTVDGNGTSEIVMSVLADSAVDKWNAVGGLAGRKDYTATNCSVRGISLVNESNGVDKCFVGGMFGIFGKKGGLWSKGTYFTPNASEIKNCTTTVVFFEVVASVMTHNICPIYE